MTSEIIIGLTGSIASGKGIAADYLKNQGFTYLSLSTEVREEATKREIIHTRKNLQDLGNLLREQEGSETLAKRSSLRINNSGKTKNIIDGIRNPGEINYFRNYFTDNFILFGIDAPLEERYQRAIQRGKESDLANFKTLEEFKVYDERDKGSGESKKGQQVLKCMEMADYFFLNNSTLEEFKQSLSQEVQIFLNQYK